MHRATWTHVCLAAVLLVALRASADEEPVSASRPITLDWAAVDAYIEARREAARIPGVALAVVQGDRIIYLRGYGAADDRGRPVTPQTPFVLGSVTKAFTALAVMQLVEAGRIELDQPVRRYLPWFRVADEQASGEITVRQLLNQTSGLSMYAGRRLLADTDASDHALEKHVRALADIRLAHSPGSRFEYSNANYTTAGLVVQTVSGLSYEEYIREKIFVPLEMHNSHALQDEAERGGLAEGHRLLFGRPVAAPHLPFIRGETSAAYLCSSAEDMAHWLIANLNEGRYDSKSVLSPEGMSVLHTPPAGSRYAMGWSQSSVGELSILMHLGEVPNFRAQTLLAPSAGLGVVALMNLNTYLDQERLAEIPNGVVSILIGRMPPEPPTASVMPIIYTAIGFVVAGQAAVLWWSLWSLGRWRRDDASIPRSARARAAYVLVPLVLDVILVVTLLVVVPDLFKISLSAMLLYQPDMSWICVGMAAFSGVWGLSRTALFLRRFAISRHRS
jgi:CubicO group peptidase (beta-lactamase class C family)